MTSSTSANCATVARSVTFPQSQVIAASGRSSRMRRASVDAITTSPTAANRTIRKRSLLPQSGHRTRKRKSVTLGPYGSSVAIQPLVLGRIELVHLTEAPPRQEYHSFIADVLQPGEHCSHRAGVMPLLDFHEEQWMRSLERRRRAAPVEPVPSTSILIASTRSNSNRVQRAHRDDDRFTDGLRDGARPPRASLPRWIGKRTATSWPSKRPHRARPRCATNGYAAACA